MLIGTEFMQNDELIYQIQYTCVSLFVFHLLETCTVFNRFNRIILIPFQFYVYVNFGNINVKF